MTDEDPAAPPVMPPPKPDLSKVPPPPREPSRRAKDLVFGYQGGQLVMLIIGIVFTLIGLPLALVFGWSLPSEVLLDVTGVETEGKVVRAEVDPSYKVNKRSATRVTIAFTVGKKSHKAEAITTDSGFLEKAQPGDAVGVVYLASDPEVARAAGQSYGFFGYIGLFTLIFPAVGFALTFFAVRSNRREIRAFTYGDATLARVTFSGLDHTTKINNRHPTVVRWEGEADGRPFTGELSAMDPEKLGDLVRAQEIVVLCDRDDPSINTAWVE